VHVRHEEYDVDDSFGDIGHIGRRLGSWEAVSLAASTNCGEVRQLRFTGSVCIRGKTATERAYLGEFLTVVANARPRRIKRQMSLR